MEILSSDSCRRCRQRMKWNLFRDARRQQKNEKKLQNKKKSNNNKPVEHSCANNAHPELLNTIRPERDNAPDSLHFMQIGRQHSSDYKCRINIQTTTHNRPTENSPIVSDGIRECWPRSHPSPDANKSAICPLVFKFRRP